VTSEDLCIPEAMGYEPTMVLAMTSKVMRRGPWDLVGCDQNQSVEAVES